MGLKKNFIYNSFLTLSQYIIGLITFPYISRVLGVSNIGIVSFVDNTINYFILFSTMGIGIMGAREIAKHRDDKEKLSTVFSSLVTLSLIFTTVVLFAYYLAINYVPQLNIYKELFFIGASKLLFSVFLIEWFYRGIENFKYITIRNICIKLLYVASLLIFVKTKDDYLLYFTLTVSTIIVNSIINTIYSIKFVRISIKHITIMPFLKQSLYLGSYAILTSMYTTFNIMYLGFVSDTIQVGYYWAALKIYGIVLGFFTAFTSVMMPRMSSLISQGDRGAFERLINKSFNLLFTICFPLIIGTTILAPQIINVLSGNGYEGAIIPMQIIMPLILVVGIAQILAIQVLMPMQKDKSILKASIIGACIGIISNLLLVKNYGCIGTAIVLLISELSVTGYYIYLVRENKLINFPWNSCIKNLFWSIPYIIICLSSKLSINNPLTSLGFAGIISVFYFIITQLYIFKVVDIKKLHLNK